MSSNLTSATRSVGRTLNGPHGAIAQLARAGALQVSGRRFDSDWLHDEMSKNTKEFDSGHERERFDFVL